MVVSDGSSDGTVSIARQFEERGVVLRAFRERQGKVACLNRVLPEVDSDIIVLSDANSMYARDGVRRLVRHFSDERVGCVCGQLDYVNPRNLPAGKGERVYWGYESLIKRFESSLGSLLGANGAIYAFRSSLFRPVDPLMFCDDVIPIRIAMEGYLTLYEPMARCTEEAPNETVQRRRRRRHASFGMRSMVHLAREAASRRQLLMLYEIFSHRIFRWLTGPALAGVLVGSAFLPGPWRGPVVAGQALLYGTALLGYLTSRRNSGWSPLYLPYYFLVTAVAGIEGLATYIRRSDLPYWEPRD
jgi:cellulose synthase/poly-beta-1,6-N-acetylglucosamine synthase-like glycosyltransferase